MHQMYLSPLTSTCSGGCGLRWQWQPVPFPLVGFVPPCLLLAAPPQGSHPLRGVSPFVCWLSPTVPSSRCWLYMAPCYPEQHLPAAVTGPNPPPAIRSHRTRPPGSPRAPGAAHPGGQRGGGCAALPLQLSGRPRTPGSAAGTQPRSQRERSGPGGGGAGTHSPAPCWPSPAAFLPRFPGRPAPRQRPVPEPARSSEEEPKGKR